MWKDKIVRSIIRIFLVFLLAFIVAALITWQLPLPRPGIIAVLIIGGFYAWLELFI